MTLSDVSIRRPVFTAMLSLALIVVGLLSFGRLPTDLYPSVNFPLLLVRVVYPGASPSDIERDITEPLEDAVAGIPGIDTVQSFTRDGYLLAILKFEMDTSLDEATNAVRDRIGAVRGQFPEAADEPVIQQIDIGALPVMVVALSSPGGLNATRAIAEERLRPLLEQVPGVGSVDVLGGQDREIQVNLDLDRMRELSLPIDGIAQRIGIENLSVPVGDFTQNRYTIGIRAEGQYRSVDDLASTVVHQTREGQQVRLRDVAGVIDGFADPAAIVRYNQQAAVTLSVLKRSGANTVAVSDGIQQKLTETIKELGDGVQYDIIVDQSIDIRANAHEVWIAIYFGGAMAVLVILFFLLDTRGTIISALALPTSVIGTFALMSAMGFSLNTMTLMALSLAIGLLIDDAVVVREAITRRLEAGDTAMVAASKGTSEIALAVLATTFSLVAVFVPVAFMSGMVGQFFKQFGLTMAAAVMLSLFVAFTLDPMLSARFTRRHHGGRGWLATRILRVLDSIDAGYQRLLDRVLRHPWLTVGSAFLAFVVTMIVATTIPTEMIPKPDRGEVQADIEMPIGTDMAITDQISRTVEAELLQIPGVYRVYTVVGNERRGNRARFRVKTVEKDRPHTLEWYEEEVRRILSKVPTAQTTLMQPAVIEGLGDWPPMMIILQGEDLDTLIKEGHRVKDMMESVPGSADVRISVSPGVPELRISVDRDLAADRGVPAGLVGLSARWLVEGQLVGSLRDGGSEADIRLRAAPRFVSDAASISLLPLQTPRGIIPLGDVAKVEMGAGPAEIQHYNRMRAVTVSTQVANGHTLGDVQTAFFAKLDKEPLPAGYFYTLDGQVRDMIETGEAMGLAVIVAAIFIFMVLASQFESLLHPFTLMVSLPLALVGAILALLLTGNSISMGAQIGIVLLMGLVTKNAILLVDGALQAMREGGADPAEAMRLAGPRRLRPILMTTAAMVLGMIPTAINSGVGAEFRAPMAIVVIGGVLSSTVLTLLVVPVAFVQMERVGSILLAIWHRISPPEEEQTGAALEEERTETAEAEGGSAAK